VIPRRTLTYYRDPGGGSFIDGTWNQPALISASFTASIQPVKPQEMLLLPEARRNEETLKLYTSTALRTADEQNNLNADQVEIDGARYEVLSVATWGNDIIPHYKALVVRMQEQP